MINVKVQEGYCEGMMNGSMIELIADSLGVLHAVYCEIAVVSEDDANAFKEIMTDCIDIAFLDVEEAKNEIKHFSNKYV